MKIVLVCYDNLTIYQVYIKSQKKIIQVKNFSIFEHYKTKATSKIFEFNENIPTFQKFFLGDNDNEKIGLSNIYKSQMIKNMEEKQPASITCISLKVNNAKSKSIAHTDQRVNNANSITIICISKKIINIEPYLELFALI